MGYLLGGIYLDNISRNITPDSGRRTVYTLSVTPTPLPTICTELDWLIVPAAFTRIISR